MKDTASRVTEAFDLASKQLGIARNFFKDDDIDNALVYAWNCFENLTNCLKDIFNKKPLYDHRPKVQVLRDYYLAGVLKQDYSKIFSKLIRYRLVAEFGPYTKIPKTYTKEDVRNYIKRAEELTHEVERHLNKNR